MLLPPKKKYLKSNCECPVLRMRKRADFVRLTQKGEKFITKGWVILYLANDSGEITFGFTASKKVGGAVQRNRAKRIMRAVSDAEIRLNPKFKLNNNGTAGINGLEIVMIARRGILDISHDVLCKDFRFFMHKRMARKADFKNSSYPASH